MPMDAADVSDEAMFSAEEDLGDDDDDEECRICRLPAEPTRPLRHPCACRGSIRFVHDDCQLDWIDTRHQRRCEVCHRDITIRLLYAADAPSRLPIYELMVGLTNKLAGLLLPLGFVIFVVCVVPEFAIHLSNLWAWRLALASSFGQVHYLLSLRLSAASVLALFALLVALEHWTELFGVAPFARWVDRLETQLLEFEGFDGLQLLALYAVEAFLMVVICDLGLACILGFLPFSLGRIILWCISCSDFCNGDEVNSYRSIVSILLTRYGFIISAGIISVGLNTFHQYLRGKPLTIAVFIRRLPGILLPGTIAFISFANFCLNFLNATMYPLLFGWWLDIWLQKLLVQQCLKGLNFCLLRLLLLPLFIGLWDTHFRIYTPLCSHFIISYFGHPAKGSSFWQAPRNYADSICRVLLLRFLMDKTDILMHVGWLVKKVTRYSFATSVVLAGLTVVMFNSAVLIFPISIGRALLFAITQMPLAGSLKSNDLLAFVVGFSIISTIIAASRDAFSYMSFGRARLVTLNRNLAKFLLVVIVPLLIGSLVDLLLVPLLAVRDDDVSVFYIWCMGYVLLKMWLKLVHRTRTTPFLAYFVDERWGRKVVRYRADYRSGAISPCWFFQDIFMPMAVKLLAALCVPYVLAKGVFLRFGYPAAVNWTVYHFAWLGILGLGALCYLAKVFCVELYASIRDDRYLIGKRVEDVADKRDGSCDINS